MRLYLTVKIIRSMPTKSCETDAIPTMLLKQILDKVGGTITSIVNISLTEGVFAINWKTAIVRPLLKKAGLDLIASNYRPVSNLLFISKVVEKCMLHQFIQHCDDRNLLPDYQSAYRKNYSCETALVGILEDILWAMERQRVTAVVAIDLSAAFDTVDHDILLDVLTKRFGVKNNALNWFDNYLRPRGLKVNVGNEYSVERPPSTMKNIVQKPIDIHGYADDHSLKRSFVGSSRKEEKATIDSLTETAAVVKVWMEGMTVAQKLSRPCTGYRYICVFSSR